MPNTLPFFKFSIIDPASGQYYFVNPGIGFVSLSLTVKYVMAPVSWQETELKWIRNMDYMGLFTALTTPYKFVKDGAKILRHLFYTEGREASGQLKVWMLNLAGGDYTYNSLPIFGLDFSTFGDNEEANDTISPVVDIKCIEDGLHKLLRENQNTSYEIPLTLANDAQNIVLDGVTLDAIYNYAPVQSDRPLTNNGTGAFIAYAYYTLDGAFDVGVPRNQLSQLADPTGGALIPGRYENYLWEALIDGTVSVNLRQGFTVTNDGSSTGNVTAIELRYLVASRPPNSATNATITQNILILNQSITPITPGNAGQFVVDTLTFGTEAPMNQGDRLYIFVKILGTGTLTTTVQWDGNPPTSIVFKTQVHYKFRRAASDCLSMRYYRVLNKLANLMTAGQYAGFSSFLANPSVSRNLFYDSKPYDTMLTSGDAIRGLADSKIKTSFSDYFDDASRQWCMGMGIYNSNALRMEPMSFFFDKNTLIADLGEVDSITTSAEEFMFTSVEVGYPDISYDEVNGRYEWNAGQEHKLPLSRNPTEQSWRSRYRADNYGVEYARFNAIKKRTADTESDNDTFILDTNGTALYRPAVTGTNIPPYFNSNFNFSLSPKRKLLRNSPLLASVLYNRPVSAQITFQTGDKNTGLSCNIGSGTVDEDAPINVGTLGSPLFQPVLFRFKTEVPLNLPALLVNPYGYFQFTYNGSIFKGFLMEVGLKPATRATYDWVLLSHPDNDLTKLVK